ncbi:uncharacterized protein LOC111902439 isoform X3 [Lactuca sativa]|uniref:Uncharacterized protein n=1 Tax=Lactuca sativa TaxID=4236 RepID=A0A9R1VW21_LACSA|nr:uncharacterized protein LOC111902439 isoform X3 [Lactuca sativa]KAJ0214987.1 hypothetical protein LSAT_V11C300145610 [Lactuca sativa]
MPDVLLTEVEVVELKSVFDLHSRMFLNLLMLTNLNRSLITSLKLLWRVAYMIRIGILRNMRFCRFLTEKSISILPETSIAESLLPSSSFTNFKVIVHLVSDSDVAAGHVDNIFQARIMPFTDDRTIVTSAADGQGRWDYF